MAYTVSQLATLANAVYENPSSGVEGWRLVAQAGSFREGFYAGVFSKGTLSALALRGTDDGFDILPDAQIFLGQLPDQFNQGLRAYSAAMLAIPPGNKLAVTGHSLGGGLACLLAVATGCPAVTFNAPGVTRSLAASLPKYTTTIASIVPSQLNNARIVNTRARFDPVSLGTGPQIGESNSIPVAGCAPVTSASRANAFAAASKVAASRSPVEAVINAADAMMLTGRFILCQHGMALMEQQLRNMPEYRRDLGW
jgi:Lipase (class 3)